MTNGFTIGSIDEEDPTDIDWDSEQPYGEDDIRNEPGYWASE